MGGARLLPLADTIAEQMADGWTPLVKTYYEQRQAEE